MISTKINNEEDTQEYLYHYTTIETLVLYILPQKTLRFSNIRETNDPEEIYDHGFQMNDDLRFCAAHRTVFLNKWIFPGIKEEVL